MKKGYVTSAAINLFANAAASVLSAVSILIVIRTLTIADWGRTAALLGVGQLLGSILSFGTPARLIRELSTQRPTAYRRNSFLFTLVRSLTGSVILVVGFLILAVASPDIGSVVVLAGGVFVSLGSTAGFISRRRYIAAAVILIGEKLLALTSLAILSSLNVLTPSAFACVLGTAGLLAGLLASALLRNGRPTLRVVATAARRQWSGSLHFGIAAVAPAFLLLDTMIVAHVAGASDAGAYAVGSRLLAPLSVVSTTLAQTLMPVLAVNGPSARLTLPAPRRWLSILAGIFFVVSVLTVVAPPLAVWLLGLEYSGAAWPIRFFVLNAGAVLVTRALATALQAWHYESLVSKLIGTSVVVALLAVVFGASLGGASAAAAGVFATNILLAIASAIAIRWVRRRSLVVAAPVEAESQRLL